MLATRIVWHGLSGISGPLSVSQMRCCERHKLVKVKFVLKKRDPRSTSDTWRSQSGLPYRWQLPNFNSVIIGVQSHVKVFSFLSYVLLFFLCSCENDKRLCFFFLSPNFRFSYPTTTAAAKKKIDLGCMGWRFQSRSGHHRRGPRGHGRGNEWWPVELLMG